ncbi:MAG TPA: hypothetical protein VFM69_15805 [Pricia sp.]|nr:hypothetical protein [Pricia sp.]
MDIEDYFKGEKAGYMLRLAMFFGILAIVVLILGFCYFLITG